MKIRREKHIMKSLFSKYKGIIKENILLVAVWGTVIFTGFLALGAIVGNIEGLIVFSGIHSLAVRLSLIYTAVHIFQHRKQIMNSRSVNVISAIAFHILLHRISIHLAITYALLHIVHHKHSIFSLFNRQSVQLAA